MSVCLFDCLRVWPFVCFSVCLLVRPSVRVLPVFLGCLIDCFVVGACLFVCLCVCCCLLVCLCDCPVASLLACLLACLPACLLVCLVWIGVVSFGLVWCFVCVACCVGVCRCVCVYMCVRVRGRGRDACPTAVRGDTFSMRNNQNDISSMISPVCLHSDISIMPPYAAQTNSAVHIPGRSIPNDPWACGLWPRSVGSRPVVLASNMSDPATQEPQPRSPLRAKLNLKLQTHKKVKHQLNNSANHVQTKKQRRFLKWPKRNACWARQTAKL